MYLARYLVILLAFGLFFLTAGCSEQQQATTQKEGTKATVEDVKKEAVDIVEVTKSYTMEQKEAYEQQLATRLDGYKQKISVFKAQMGAMKGNAQKVMQKKIDTLQAQLEEMKNKVLELQDASGEAWNDLKKDLDKAGEDMNEAFTNAKTNFRE